MLAAKLPRDDSDTQGYGGDTVSMEKPGETRRNSANGGGGRVHALRTVASRGWAGVAALVLLASAAVGVVLAAGLEVWQRTVGAAPSVTRDLGLARPSGIITVPDRSSSPATPPTTAPAAPGPAAVPVPAQTKPPSSDRHRPSSPPPVPAPEPTGGGSRPPAPDDSDEGPLPPTGITGTPAARTGDALVAGRSGHVPPGLARQAVRGRAVGAGEALAPGRGLGVGPAAGHGRGHDYRHGQAHGYARGHAHGHGHGRR